MILTAKTISFRPVEIEDAEFILNLRLNDKLNQYLSPTEPDINQQKEWINSYKSLEKEGKEFYFIITRNDNNNKVGTVRLYDFDQKNNSFCWGSWILNKEKTKSSAVESALLVYKYGFEELGFTRSHYVVHKENKKIISFHLKLGAQQVGETADSYSFYYFPEKYLFQKKKFYKFLT